MRMALGRGTTRDVRSLLARQRADAIVVDGVMLTSLREALSTGTPTAVLFHSLGKFWEHGMGNPALNAMLRPFGLGPMALLERCAARLLPTDRDIDPAGQEAAGSRSTGSAQPSTQLLPRHAPLGARRSSWSASAPPGRRTRTTCTGGSSQRWGN
jgi:hypothetical protein